MGFFDANGDCTMQESEIMAMCAEYEAMCLSFIGIKRQKSACQPIYLGEDAGWTDLFKYYDDGDCIMQASELSRMCAAVPDLCRKFLYGDNQVCSPAPLGSGGTSWATLFTNYSTAPCKLNSTQQRALCVGDTSACRALGNFSSPCQTLYLGDGIGFADVRLALANTSDCVLDLNKLSAVCAMSAAQCATFLQADSCVPVWLGSSIGYGDVYTQNGRGQCRLDDTKLAKTCATTSPSKCRQKLAAVGCPAGWHDPDDSIVTGCLACQAGQFSTARSLKCTDCAAGWADTDKNPATPCQKCAKGTTSNAGASQCTSALKFCPAVNLGPHVGIKRVFQWSAKDSSCVIMPGELVAACGQKYYAECLAFIGNLNRHCDPVYLGDKIGWVAVLNYDAATSSCKVNHGELAAVCKGNMRECVAFLQASHGRACDPMYLGPKTGWAVVHKMVAGNCSIDDGMLKQACGGNLVECKLYTGGRGSGVKGSECQPLWLGDAVGWANVFHWSSATQACELDSLRLQSVCVGHEDACRFAISAGVRAITNSTSVG
jgi:hypothetical protein